jgi:hypothetical protein
MLPVGATPPVAHLLAATGCVPGVTLQPHPPTVYLVALALRFHPTTGSLLRYLNPQMQVV